MRKAPLAAATVAVGGAIALALAGVPAYAQLTGGGDSNIVHACGAPTAGHMTCLALMRTDINEPNSIGPNAATPSGLGAPDLQSAYGLPADGGAGATVAIVDAYDDPNAEDDLNAYRAQYGLGDADFTKVAQDGSSNYPRANAGWATEISLDLDMVSAIAPKAKILLVEANNSSMANLGASVNTAVSMGAQYVSNSYGGSESSQDSTYDENYFNHPGVAITVSSGDSGYGTEYPAASQYVTAVGGTSLSQDSSSDRGWSETAWNGAGSGCASNDDAPSWQDTSATGCNAKAIADVSAVADPNTGVAVYDTYQENGWLVVGGTSASSPIIAGVYADAGTPGSSDYPASYPWANSSGLNDVTSGSNGNCNTSQWCNAGTGWDGPTGLGTPNGTSAFTAG